MKTRKSSFAILYEQLIFKLLYEYDYVCKPRDMEIREMINVNIVLTNPYNFLFTNKYRDLPLEYLASELILYYSGTNDANKFIKSSNFWDKLKNKDNTINSAYGYLLFNDKEDKCKQWDWAKNSLIVDKDSRQAILHFNKPRHQDSNTKDFPCTLSGQFIIRDNYLNLIINMRSNDLFFGLTYDLPFFCMLMQVMQLELIKKYPDLEIGNYYHNVGSLHLYEKDFNIAQKMLNSDILNKEYMPKITKNPILNKDIIDMSNGKEYNGHNEFFNWLEMNRKKY